MILLSGCSFVDNSDMPRAIFGRDAYNKHRVKIVGYGGAGNHWMSRGILENLEHVDNVLVLWTGFSRLDIEVPVEMVDDIRTYYNDTDIPIHYTVDKKNVWFHSGGWDGKWCNHPRTKYADYMYKFMQSQYKPLNWDHLTNKSLIDIAGCLNTLEAKGIPYKYGFISDIFKDHSDTQGSLSGPVSRSNPLLELLNWDHCLSSSPFDYCVENNLLSDDNFHPSKLGYQSWWNSVKNEVPSI